jgi:hypothetical protein
VSDDLGVVRREYRYRHMHITFTRVSESYKRSGDRPTILSSQTIDEDAI